MDKYLAELQDLQSDYFKRGRKAKLIIGTSCAKDYYCVDATVCWPANDNECRYYTILSFYDEAHNDAVMMEIVEAVKSEVPCERKN